MTSAGEIRPDKSPPAALATPKMRAADVWLGVQVATRPFAPAAWSTPVESRAMAAPTIDGGVRVPKSNAEPEELNSARNSVPLGKPALIGKSVEPVVPEI